MKSSVSEILVLLIFWLLTFSIMAFGYIRIFNHIKELKKKLSPSKRVFEKIKLSVMIMPAIAFTVVLLIFSYQIILVISGY